MTPTKAEGWSFVLVLGICLAVMMIAYRISTPPCSPDHVDELRVRAGIGGSQVYVCGCSDDGSCSWQLQERAPSWLR